MYFILAAVFVTSVCILYFAKKLAPKAISLDGGHVLVTGGSSGIGKAVAVESAKRGANVTIIARNKLNLEKAQTEIQKHLAANRKVQSISVDLTSDYGAVEQAVQEAERAFGPVLVLVNSAGNAICGTFCDLKPETFKEMMDVNYMSAVYTTKAALPRMMEQQRGRVVFLCSQGGQLGVFGYTAYSGSKFALRGLAETLQMEVKPYNIRVTLAFPPDTDTPGFANENKGKPKETHLISETSGLLKPEDVALNILNDAQVGKFACYQNLEGWLLCLVTAGMCPATSLLDVLTQVGKFACYQNLEGWLLCLVTAGMCPATSLLDVFTQFLLMGVGRVVTLFYLAGFDNIVLKCKLERDAAKLKCD